MADKELTFAEIADECNLPLSQLLQWAELGYIDPAPAERTEDFKISLSSLAKCMDAHGIPLPDTFQPLSSKVLIIDDDLPMSKAIRRALLWEGYDIHMARDGVDAGRLIDELQPDLVTLDLSMPGLDGFDLLRYLRLNPRLNHLKILVISALPDPQLKRALDLGADRVLSKPFENSELQQAVAGLLTDGSVRT